MVARVIASVATEEVDSDILEADLAIAGILANEGFVASYPVVATMPPEVVSNSSKVSTTMD